MYLTARRTADELNLELGGDWRAPRFAAIEAELAAVDIAGLRRIVIDPGHAEVDLTGAWLLRDFLNRARAGGASVQFQGTEPSALALVERCKSGDITLQTHVIEWPGPAQAVEGLGRRVLLGFDSITLGLSFLGRITVAFMRALSRLRLRPVSICAPRLRYRLSPRSRSCR